MEKIKEWKEKEELREIILLCDILLVFPTKEDTCIYRVDRANQGEGKRKEE